MLEAIELDDMKPTCRNAPCSTVESISKSQLQQCHVLAAVKSENTRLRREIETKDVSFAISQAPTRQRLVYSLFSEQILVGLDYHTAGPFRISSVANSKQLCRL